MKGQRRLLTDRDLLAAQETEFLRHCLTGAERGLQQARQKDDLAGVRLWRRRRQQIKDEIARRAGDGVE